MLVLQKNSLKNTWFKKPIFYFTINGNRVGKWLESIELDTNMMEFLKEEYEQLKQFVELYIIHGE